VLEMGTRSPSQLQEHNGRRPARTFGRALGAFSLVIAAWTASPIRCQAPVAEDDSSPVVVDTEQDEQPVEIQDDFGEEAIPNPCALPQDDPAAWIDWVQRSIFKSVCASARWFDNLFGNDAAFVEAEPTIGWFRGAVVWNERDGFDVDGTLRTKFDLPNVDKVERRVRGFFGQVSDEEFSRETGSPLERRPDVFRNTEDEEWLLGLGYSPIKNSRRRLDIGGGVNIAWPPDVWARARYRRHAFFGERTLGRYRQTVFWKQEDGAGASTIFDLEHMIRKRFLLGWNGSATISQATEGVDWLTSFILYQALTPGSALAYRFAIDGETGADVPLNVYSIRLTYRGRVSREWLFLEVRPEVAYRKFERGGDWDVVPGLYLGFELHFGQDAGQARRRL
jgi:hypothetical protein